MFLAALSLCVSVLAAALHGASASAAVSPCHDAAHALRPACGVEPATQLAALQSFYAATGGAHWRNNFGWTAGSGACHLTLQGQGGAGAAASGSPAADASYCCMHGVTCCAAGSGNNSNASGQCCGPGTSGNSSSPCGPCANATSYLVSEIDLTSNGLSGDRLDAALAALAPLNCSLKTLHLPRNNLKGSIGEGISVFQELVSLSFSSNMLTGSFPAGLRDLTNLTQLDFTNNHMGGTVPGDLCSKALGSTLADVMLSNNQFNGTFSVPGCHAMVNLGLAYNNFTALGNFSGYRNLHLLRHSFNSLRGSIPNSLRDAVTMVSWLGGIGGPQPGVGLSGTLPQFLTQLTDLAVLDLGANALTGTIPELFQKLGALITLDLQENMLTGTVPSSIGSPRSGPLSALRFNDNYMYGTIPDSEGMAQLTNSAEKVVDLSSNYMHCCGTGWNGSLRLMSYEAVNYSAPRLPSYLKQSSVSQYVAVEREAMKLQPTGLASWGAMRCPLLMASSTPPPDAGGYHGSYLDFYDVLSWKIDPKYYMYENCSCEAGYQLTPVDSPQVRVVPLMACTPVPSAPWIKHNLWIIAVILVGVLSLLTCGLCYRRHTRPALLQAVINLRKRVQGEPTNGQVCVVNTDIEGYSDLMQQAPDLMKDALVMHNATIRKARWTCYGYTMAQEGDSYTLCFCEAFDAVAFCLMTQQLLMRQTWPEGLFPRPSRASLRRRTGAGRLLSNMVGSTQSFWRSMHGLSRLSSLFSWGSTGLQAAPPGCAPAAAAAVELPSSSRSSPASDVTAPSEIRLPVGSADSGVVVPESSAPSQGLFHGLRVRMGVATGHLQEGTLLRGSAIMDMAKVIADAGAGGQVLMDEATFRGIKERLEELAAVDHTGYNSKKLQQWSIPWWRFWRPCRPHDHFEALVFDMGRYVSSTSASSSNSLSTTVLTHSRSVSVNDSSEASRRGGVESPPPSQQDRPSLRLYQIVPPALMARAKYFGSKLALKEEWVCVDPPYFAAPGTMAAPLTLAEAELSPVLPSVTMVFCCVEGGRLFAARSRKQARWVSERIAGTARSILLQVPGGYLCREDIGELKYMLAFPCPAAAIAWCLVTQEALMYVAWPAFITQYERFRQELGPDKELLFRGPRLKMGVCTGVPKFILPDHLGRADYHGTSVNQAARFMDAGAHGGQVVCEEALAVEVLRQFTEAPRLRPQLVALPPVAAAAGGAQEEQQQQQSATPASGGIHYASRARHSSIVLLPGGGTRLLSVSEDVEGELAAGRESGAHAGASLAQRSQSSPPAAPSPPVLVPVTGQTQVEEVVASAPDSYSPFLVAGGGSSTTASTSAVAASSPAWLASQPWQYLAVPDGEPYVSRVEAHRIGVFRLKGSSEPVSLAQLVLASLRRRRYPSEPPRGKGSRISEGSGIIAGTDAVQLPNVSIRLKSAWVGRTTQAGAGVGSMSLPTSLPSLLYSMEGAPEEPLPLHGRMSTRVAVQ